MTRESSASKTVLKKKSYNKNPNKIKRLIQYEKMDNDKYINLEKENKSLHEEINILKQKLNTLEKTLINTSKSHSNIRYQLNTGNSNNVQLNQHFTNIDDNIQIQNQFEAIYTEDEIDRIEDTQLEDDNSSNQNSFELVKKKIKKRNREATNDDSTIKKVKVSNNTNNLIKDNMSNENKDEGLPLQNKKKIPPPINIHSQKVSGTIELLKAANIQEFNIKVLNQSKHTIKTQNIDIYRKIQDLLKEVETPFYTFTPKTEKPKTLILKGLDADGDITEIIEYLKEFENENLKFTKISRLATKKSVKNNINLPHILVQISPQSNIKELLNIRIINYHKVYWEKLKKKDFIVQCMRCQRFGHMAVNCHLSYRCVKCQDTHLPGKCQKDKDTEQQPYCINCKQFGHPASYKGCQLYQNLKSRLQQKTAEVNKKSNNLSNSLTQANTTYADAVRNSYGKDYNNTFENLNSKIEDMYSIIKKQNDRIEQLMRIIIQHD